jgi:hypothetical protein
MINKMKKTPLIDPNTGNYNLKYNQQNLLEDFFIPVRGGDNTTRIDTAKGLEYNAIEDVTYFREKLFAALKIPKAFMGYEKDLSGKATLAAEDIRFARTVERIQRIIVSELTKIALVHLYAHGYTNESAANFTLSLTNPSIIYEQERIALFKEKIATAKEAMEGNLLPKDYLYDKIFQFSEDQYTEMEDLIVEDKKKIFRLKQIEEEGNDPAETGQVFGTPHQLASLYGGKKDGNLEVPTGYDETEKQDGPGRPKKYQSKIGTDASAFGRDAIGKKDMKSGTSPEDSMKVQYKGGPLVYETSMDEYLRNKAMLDDMGRKTNLFKGPSLLSEDNIKSDLL